MLAHTPPDMDLPAPDPTITLRVYIRRVQAMPDGPDGSVIDPGRLPDALLRASAGVQTVLLYGLIATRRRQNARRRAAGETPWTPPPSALDMRPYASCSTVAALIRRYANRHAPDRRVMLSVVLQGIVSAASELQASPADRRRWLYVVRLLAPPQTLRQPDASPPLRAPLRPGVPGP